MIDKKRNYMLEVGSVDIKITERDKKKKPREMKKNPYVASKIGTLNKETWKPLSCR